MFVGGASRNRFSLLLLDEGEYYFEDFEATLYPTARDDATSLRKKQSGRLKICSKSLLFTPKETKYPILRIMFDSMVACGKWNGPLVKLIPNNPEIFVIRCDQYTEMKKGNQNHPYVSKKERKDFRFALSFEKLVSFLPNVQNLLRISQLYPEDTEKQLKRIIEQREASIEFNSTWLVNLSEKSKLQVTGVQVTPLVRNPGRILITDQRLYFQPLNNAGPNPVDRYDLSSIERVVTRRHALRHIGLEIFFKSQKSLYLSFKTPEIRDQVCSIMKEIPAIPTTPPNDLELTTYKWRNRTISNYEYLMYLNTLAHRSLNDLTQYPVFPWIIADYTSNTLDLTNTETFRDLSKPIGALNEDRLQRSRNRFKEMVGMEGQIPFLYGTHYSAPGYVLYFLVRQAPEYMLRLQGGRFDTPDRMFHSIAETWQGVLENPSDVKELIPEFYSGSSEFLTNSQDLPLGQKHNGTNLEDVVLPPWASSPDDFMKKCKEALESDYVSAHLHEWIDLIFGFAQRGEKAIERDNGAVDIEKIYDPREKKSIEAQINEFGQTPHQLFTTPHPQRIPDPNSNTAMFSPSIQRHKKIEAKAKAEGEGEGEGGEEEFFVPEVETFSFSLEPEIDPTEWPSIIQMECKFSYKLHRESITAMSMTNDEEILYSVSKNGCLKLFDIKNRKQMRNIPLSKLALSSCILSDDEENVVVGAWDNYLYLFSKRFGAVKEKVYAHEDAVSCVQMRGDTIVSGSWDSSVKVWKLTNSAIVSLSSFGQFESNSEIKCVDLSYDGNICICGTENGKMMLCDQRAPNLRRTLDVHTSAVSAISFSPDSNSIVAGCADGTIKYIDVGTFSHVFTGNSSEPILTVRNNKSQFLVGTNTGSVQLWDANSKEKVHVLSDLLQPQQDITCFVIGKETLITGSSDCTINLWR